MTGEAVVTRRFSRAGITVVADAHGSQADPLVVLVHGGGQTRHSWDVTAKILAQQGFYALTVDLRGHGESDWAGPGGYEIADLGADVQGVVAGAGGPGVLIGASLGGMSSLFAIDSASDPTAVARGLVLVDVAPALNPAGVERIRTFMFAYPEGFANLDEAADAVAAYNPNRARPISHDGLRKNLRRGEDGRWRWHWDPEVMAPHPNGVRMFRDRAWFEGAVRALKVPLLLVRGAQSDVLAEGAAEQLSRLAPHAEVVDATGAGHMVAGDANDAFNDAIIRFLQRL